MGYRPGNEAKPWEIAIYGLLVLNMLQVVTSSQNNCIASAVCNCDGNLQGYSHLTASSSNIASFLGLTQLWPICF